MRKKMMRHDDFGWKQSRYLEEPPAPAGGSGGGGAGTAVASPPAKEPPVKEPAAGDLVSKTEYEKLKADMEALQRENQQHKMYFETVSPHVVIDEDGKIKITQQSDDEQPPAAKKKTPEEIVRETNEQYESSRTAEAEIVKINKDDPFLEDNMKLARMMMKNVAPDRRNQNAWENAYNLAKSKKFQDYLKAAREDERRKTTEELTKKFSGSIPRGSETKKEGKDDIDVDSVQLTSAEYAVAQKQVEHGLVPDIATYKREKVRLEREREENR